MNKKQQPKDRSDQTEQSTQIAYDQQKQSNQPKSSDSIILESDIIANGKAKRKSIYSDVLCIICKDKIYKLYCDKCKRAYGAAEKRKNYHAKKAKLHAKVHQNNVCSKKTPSDYPKSTNQSQPNHKYNADESEFNSYTNTTNANKTPFGVNKSTLANIKWGFRKLLTKSETKTAGACVALLKSLSLGIKYHAVELLQENVQENIIDQEKIQYEKFTNMIKALKEDFGEKSEAIYTVLTYISPFFTGKSTAFIRNILGVNFDNAKKNTSW